MPDEPADLSESPQQFPQPRTRIRVLLRLCAAALLLLLMAVAAGLLWFRHAVYGRVSRRDFEATVVIRRGASYGAIVRKIREAGMLRHPIAFDYLAWRRGDSHKMKPGRYKLHSAMSALEVYEALLEGAPIVVTIPDGWTIEQIDERLLTIGLLSRRGEFCEAARDPRWLAANDVDTSSAEGYLLPDTYHVDPGTTAGEFLGRMAVAFRREFAAEAATTAPQSLTWPQVVTLASMIEREARNEEEKPIIASVYYNRLRRGMKLDCDATVRYAISEWREPLSRADLKTTSPYNTYFHPGLPPGPICCVERSSVEAVLKPAQTDFLYYCYKGDQSHHFSRSFREHNAAVKKYLRKQLTPTGRPG